VFTARYALSRYIKQIRFVFKGLIRDAESQNVRNAGRNASRSCVEQYR
jgi:hypothetical protein